MISHDLKSVALERHTFIADVVGAIAVGTLAAQHFIDEISRDQAMPNEAVERIRLLQIEQGVDSPAIGAFLAELAKRASR